ncbi:MAG: 4-hydroxy-tetrahydrodipicolinate synthase [Methanomassiliicoccales archaeon]
MSGEINLEGVFPALITPFTKERDVNEEKFREHIRNIHEHVDGFVPCGTTGEFDYLTMEERKRLFDICIEEAEGKPVIAGTGAPGTKQVIELTRYAEEAGADASLVVTPYFIHPSDKGIFEHFWQVERSTDLPLILYNIPPAVGGVLPRRVVEDLAEMDNVVALKDSSGDLPYTMEIIEKVKGNIDVLVGNDEVVLPSLAGGCKGMILGSANVYPDIWQRVFQAFKEGDMDTARELQFEVQKLSRIFVRYGGMVPIKAALRYMGTSMGRTRHPLVEGGVILHEDREEIKLELEKIGKIPPSEPPAEIPERPLEERFEDLDISPDSVLRRDVLAGSGAAGEGKNRVMIDLVAGPNDGPVGEAFSSQITYLRRGYEALPSVLEPNLSAKPHTLIIPTVELKSLRQANIMYGPAQAGIAKAISDKVESGEIPREVLESHVMLTKAFVQPNALDRSILYHNFYRATTEAIGAAFSGGVR